MKNECQGCKFKFYVFIHYETSRITTEAFYNLTHHAWASNCRILLRTYCFLRSQSRSNRLRLKSWYYTHKMHSFCIAQIPESGIRKVIKVKKSTKGKQSTNWINTDHIPFFTSRENVSN